MLSLPAAADNRDGVTEQHEDKVDRQIKDLQRQIRQLQRQLDKQRKAAGPPATQPPEQEKLKRQGAREKTPRPLLSALGAHVSGGVTGILQGGVGNPGRFGGDRADGELSADLYVEGDIGANTTYLLRFDFARRDGLADLPPLATNPDGNPSGPNGDVETFDSPQSLNVDEARITHAFIPGRVEISVGQTDLTAFFDDNAYANDETSQYLANQFVNNIAIDFGGDGNFFGPGAVLHVYPGPNWTLHLGYFEGDGNYQHVFNNPFVIGQIAYTAHWARIGHYRLYGWTRQTDHCHSSHDPVLFLTCEQIAPPDRVRLQGHNAGVGISIDQELTDSLGVWSRVGYQDSDVAAFNIAASAGLVDSGPLAGRPQDTAGIAYGANRPSNVYRRITGHSRVEHYAELYYRYVVSGDGDTPALSLSPDLQLIVNPDGDGAIDPVGVYGLRVQASF